MFAAGLRRMGRLAGVAVAAGVVFGLCGSGAVWAQGVTAEARVQSSTVYEGEMFRFQIWVEGSDEPEQPDLSGLADFEAVFTGGGSNNRTSVVIVNGQMQRDESRAYVFNWSLTPKRGGVLTIPSIGVKAGGVVASTQPLSIRVTAPSEDSDVRLVVGVSPANPYVGEPTTLQVKLFLKKRMDNASFVFRGVEPLFSVPQPDPVRQQNRQSAIEILGERAPTQNAQEVVNGEEYYTFTAERAIIPARAGEAEISGTVAGKLMVSSGGFFDAGEWRSVSVPSNSVKVTVRDLPRAGRPAGFNDLVGQFTVSASADPVAVNVGDPVTLRITVNGSGPMDRVPRPDLKRILGDRFRVPDDMASPELRPGQVVFTQTVRPTRADAKEIPAIEVAYFDTRTGAYGVARSSPIALRVAETKVVTASDAVAASASAVESAELKERVGGLEANTVSTAILTDERFDVAKAARSPAVLAVAGGPAVAYAATALAVFVRRRAGADPARNRRRAAGSTALREVASATGAEAPAVISRALTGYVADRFGLLAAGLTPRECEERLSAVDAEGAAAVRGLLDRCDAARFAGMSVGEASDLRARAAAAVERLERSKGGGQ